MGMSVNTNVGAMAALQALNETSKGLSVVQSRINSGLNVASTKDDSAAFTIAQGLRGDLGGLKAVNSSLSRAKSVADVAVAGAEQISDVVNQMKTLAKQASDDGISDESRAAYNKDFTALRDQISTIVDSSEFNGTNLLKTGGGTVSALQSLTNKATGTDTYDPDTLSIANQEIDLPATETASAGVGTGVLGQDSEIDTAAKAKAMVDTLDTLGSSLNTKLSDLGSGSRKIDAQMTFTSKLSDAIESGVGKLVDADLAKESAKLQALQVKQQLGVQALSIANQAPQTITSLFR
ncbi:MULTISPECIES: flagellin [Sphingomonas]|jgi:flagellin|uniref:Flagellin n=1 Tax=Sphingomonas aerolata TaxID=185951 RepID=A0A2T4YP62_9SPHN|nr:MULTISPECIES: flagellin [Sphingomonas]RZM29231.1 MAG: flagellin [Sphingomonas sp.]KHA62915.1 flagellin [Sphingomonas sp. Ant20]KQM91031.1 flagellin [Sphingomonas sp. Leaf226]KQN13940.1 flagellin [Sphingomonas sp. Leaf30]MBB3587934.1 flagellin [Sphingomonas sp. BK481]